MEAMIRRIVREECLEALIHFANTQAQARATTIKGGTAPTETGLAPAPAPKAKKEKPAPAVAAPVAEPVVVKVEVPEPTPVTDKVVEAIAPLGETTVEPLVTEDMLRKLCVEVSNKLGNADRVKKVLEGFGGKVYQVKDLVGAYEAIKMLVETTNDSW
jgi:hypothetical protein